MSHCLELKHLKFHGYWTQIIATTACYHLDQVECSNHTENEDQINPPLMLLILLICGEQGWQSGQSTHLHPMWPGFDSQSQCHMWVEFVVGSCSYSERFFSGYSCFPPSTKTNISKSQFNQEMVDRRATLWNPLKFPFSLFFTYPAF